jgi:hypothetical protein
MAWQRQKAVTMIGLSATEQTRLEGLLGEPLIASDPLIEIKQVGAVLGLTVPVVRGLIDSGALPRQLAAEGELATRTIRLADVLAWEKLPARIAVTEAAEILDVSLAAVHRLTAVGLLQWSGGRLPLARSEVDTLAARRDDWLTLAEASRALCVTPEEVHRLLGSGALVHTTDVSRPVDRAQLPPPQPIEPRPT